MSNCTRLIAIISTAFIFSACATIVSHTNWPLAVQSDPSGAHVVITNRKGAQVFEGKTPTAMKLKSGSAFFSKESYVVTLTMNGYEPKKINVECKLNGWYIGNILFGGVIGFLIIDPATGAMYKLNTEGVEATLVPSATGAAQPTLKIINRNDLSQEQQRQLVRLMP